MSRRYKPISLLSGTALVCCCLAGIASSGWAETARPCFEAELVRQLEELAEPRYRSPKDVDRLVRQHLALTHRIADSFKGAAAKRGIHQDDLRSAARETLFMAVRRAEIDEAGLESYVAAAVRYRMLDTVYHAPKLGNGESAKLVSLSSPATKQGQEAGDRTLEDVIGTKGPDGDPTVGSPERLTIESLHHDQTSDRLEVYRQKLTPPMQRILEQRILADDAPASRLALAIELKLDAGDIKDIEAALKRQLQVVLRETAGKGPGKNLSRRWAVADFRSTLSETERVVFDSVINAQPAEPIPEVARRLKLGAQTVSAIRERLQRQQSWFLHSRRLERTEKPPLPPRIPLPERILHSDALTQVTADPKLRAGFESELPDLKKLIFELRMPPPGTAPLERSVVATRLGMQEFRISGIEAELSRKAKLYLVRVEQKRARQAAQPEAEPESQPKKPAKKREKATATEREGRTPTLSKESAEIRAALSDPKLQERFEKWLSDREREVLRLRILHPPGPVPKQTEVGQKIGVNQSRVNAIELSIARRFVGFMADPTKVPPLRPGEKAPKPENPPFDPAARISPAWAYEGTLNRSDETRVRMIRSRLSERERYIFDRRIYPPKGQVIPSRKELSDALAISAERVRQIENHLRRKLPRLSTDTQPPASTAAGD